MVIYRGPDGKFASPPKTTTPISVTQTTTPISVTQTPAPKQVITAYKGFNLIDGKLDCRGHQYQIGRRDTLKPELCYGKSGMRPCYYGFHACKTLWEVLHFYPLSLEHVYAEIQMHGNIMEETNKIVSLSITPVKQMHWAHIINRLALELNNARKQTDTAHPNTAYNTKYDSSKHKNYQINTQSGGLEHITIPACYINAYQLCTRRQTQMFNFSKSINSLQVAAADNINQFATSGAQIMAGNYGVTTFQGVHGKIEVLGRNCTVNVIGNARIKATEGTIVNIVGSTSLQRVVEKDIANQWLYVRNVTKPTKQVYDLAP